VEATKRSAHVKAARELIRRGLLQDVYRVVEAAVRRRRSGVRKSKAPADSDELRQWIPSNKASTEVPDR
jgi:hypothetical protein